MPSAVSENRTAHLLLLYGLLAAPVALALLIRFYWPATGLLDVTNQPIGRDFLNMWGAAKLALAGRVADLFHPEAYRAALEELFGQNLPRLLWSYPPHVLLLIWPLGLMSYSLALAVWTIAGFALFVWTVVGLRPLAGRGPLVLALAVAPATLACVMNGQNGLMTAALFLGGFRLMERRPLAAGFLFGVLACKPQLGVLIPLVLALQRAWPTMMAAAAASAALVLAELITFGIEPWRSYLTVTIPLERNALVDFRGFLSFMMPSTYAALRLLGAAPFAGFLAQLITATLTLAATVVTIAKPGRLDQQVMITAVATFLVLPYAFNYDMTIIAGALAWSLQGRGRISSVEYYLYGAAWILPLAMIPLNQVGWPLAPALLLAVFVASLRPVEGASHVGAEAACSKPGAAPSSRPA